jgi:fibrillarin-like rRNA methylase
MFLGTILAERRKVYEVEITSKEVLMKYGTLLDVFIDYVFTDDVLVVSTTDSISIYSINKRRFNSSSGLVITSMKMSDCINGQVDLSKILMSASVVPSGNEDKADEDTLQVYIMALARPTLLRMEVKMKEVDGGGAVDYE